MSQKADVAACVRAVLDRWGAGDILITNAALPDPDKFAPR